ncbi:MAG: GspE/PulE family protein [Desulfobacteraceae bacterium]|nr:GspE/PulE family protein [Desulfobacteraceae bacterium]
MSSNKLSSNKLSSNKLSSPDFCKILFNAGLISANQAKDALKKEKTIIRVIKKERGKKNDSKIDITFVDVILYLKLKRADQPSKRIDEDIIYEIFAKKWGIPFRKIDPLQLDLNIVTKTIPKSFAKKHLLLPIEIKEGRLVVALADPDKLDAIRDVERVANLKVVPVISPRSDIIKMIDEFFGFRSSIIAAEELFSGNSVDLGNLEQFVSLQSDREVNATDQHIVNAVNHLFSYAFDQKASDIHIEPKREESFARMRIDGVLHTVHKLPKTVHNAIVSRIKTLSRLDMAEKRRPQDGRIKFEKDGTEVEIRVSTIPVAFGEKVVMRIMDPEILFQELDVLGFSADTLDKYINIIRKPFGIVLVTGPTGSGKSTTLYSSLKTLSSSEVNITTVEDPIEMIHEDFNQIAVQPAIGVTFDSILRNIMRQDPDIIMVGEIRDLQTAQSAVQAALTGHLVLSTLHTNDAVSAIARLLDLGIPSYLIQSSVVGLIAQRLVRKICPFCSTVYEMDASELTGMGLEIKKKGKIKLKYGKGCIKCRNTGYKGRTAVYEILPYTDLMRSMTSHDVDIAELRKHAVAEGLTTVREDGIRKMLKGITTYQEVLRVTWEGH